MDLWLLSSNLVHLHPLLMASLHASVFWSDMDLSVDLCPALAHAVKSSLKVQAALPEWPMLAWTSEKCVLRVLVRVQPGVRSILVVISPG